MVQDRFPLLDLQTWVEKGIVKSRQEARSLASCLLGGQGAHHVKDGGIDRVNNLSSETTDEAALS
jgi:hypothetical protein